MNHKTQLQSPFFEALSKMPQVDLQVRYFNGLSKQRSQQGFMAAEYTSYERELSPGGGSGEWLATLPDWQTRVHIIAYSFAPELARRFAAAQIPWCQWSEVFGVSLSSILSFRPGLYRSLRWILYARYRSFGRFLDQSCLGVFGQGKLAVDFYRKIGVRQQKLAELVYCTMPLPELPPDPAIVNFAAGRKVFVCVAALCRRKGTDLLIEAMDRMRQCDCCLVLCGAGSQDYQKLVAQKDLSQKIMLYGPCQSQEIAKVYAAAHVAVLASRFDGWGAVLNEAASLGKPLISTDMCGAAWHLIGDGQNGFRIPAGQIKPLTVAMSRYLDEPGLITRHGTASKTLYFENFTPQKNVERLIQAISQWSDKK